MCRSGRADSGHIEEQDGQWRLVDIAKIEMLRARQIVQLIPEVPVRIEGVCDNVQREFAGERKAGALARFAIDAPRAIDWHAISRMISGFEG
jgi:hypothetical protein